MMLIEILTLVCYFIRRQHGMLGNSAPACTSSPVEGDLIQGTHFLFKNVTHISSLFIFHDLYVICTRLTWFCSSVLLIAFSYTSFFVCAYK